MTPEQYSAKINGIIKQLEKENRPLAQAAADAHKAIRARVFPVSGGSEDIKGLNVSSGVPFSGERKGGYSLSYAEFRKKKGRQVNAVNLQFTGALMRGFQLKKTNNQEWESSPNNREMDKAGYAEDTYNKNIFGISKSERELFNKTASKLFYKMFI